MKKYKIGYTAGVFDLFHVGHLNLIRRAKEECELLIVGVLNEALVIKYKRRPPYIPLEERLDIVRSIKFVDRAEEVNSHSIDKLKAWEIYRFDCLFSGDDWSENEGWLRDKERLKTVGSDICFFPYTERTSSSQIKKAINPEKGEKKKLLFGAGKYGKAALDYYGAGQVLAFVDHDQAKKGQIIQGKRVLGVEEMLVLMEKYEVVIACRKYEDILGELDWLGIHDVSVYRP